MRVPSVDVLIALVTSALVIAVKNLNGKVSLESANGIPNILMKFLLPFCSCNKTWITDILNVKKTLHKVLPFTTLCATPPNTTAPLFHKLVTRVFPAGHGDKTYGQENDVNLKTAAYTWSALFDT